MPGVLSFDIGNNSLKIYVAKTNELIDVAIPNNLVVNGEIPMPVMFTDFLKTIKAEHSLPKGPCTLVLSSPVALFRRVEMPVVPEQQLELNLPYEFGDYINSDFGSYYYDYCVEEEVHENDDTMKLLAACISKAKIAEYVSIFKDAGFEVNCILPEEIAMVNVMQNACFKGKVKADESSCIVEIGHLDTHVYMFKGDKLVTDRVITIGGADIDDAISRAKSVDIHVAHTYKVNNFEDVVNHENCFEVYNDLAREVIKVINFYRYNNRESAVEKIYFAGGQSEIAALEDVICSTNSLTKDSVSHFCNLDEKKAMHGIYAFGALVK